MNKTVHLLALLITATIGLNGCNSSSSNTSSKGTPDTTTQEVALSESELEKAKTNYVSFCGGCHGRELETFTNRHWKHGSSRESLFQGIKHGYPDGGMPAFDKTFTDAEINHLVSYIQTGIRKSAAQESSQTTQKNVIKSQALNFVLDTVVTGLEVPWGMAFLPNGEMLITERSGILYRLTKNKQLEQVSGGPEVLAEGQGGLLDVELHPDFAKNNIIYLSYSAIKQEGGKALSTTAVMRAKLNGNQLTEQKVVFEALPYSTTRHHYGSRLEFGIDGNLYVSVGDRGNHDENPQSLERGPGKLHRIKEDGSIPSDNPFVNTPKAVKSIWSYGHRNIQGMQLHPETGVLWTNEHGPRGGDEINIPQKGKNYGWPVISYGINYNGTILTKLKEKEGMEQPMWYWTPSIGPSGMAFVTNKRYKSWVGDVLSGSLSFKFLNRSKVDGTKVTGEEKLLEEIGRVRDVRESPDGYIYFATEKPGVIYRIVPVE